MDVLNKAGIGALMSERGSFCVSLYLPTHRAGVEVQQDPIRFKNLLRQAEEGLQNNGLRRAETEKILGPAQQLLADNAFWQHQSDGLAVLASPATFRTYRVPVDFPELVVVTDRFHIKPLLTLLSGDGRFYILALSQNNVRLLQGTHHSVGELDLRGVPKSLAEALGAEERQRQLQFHTASRGGTAIFHGHGGSNDDSVHKKDLLRYFKQVDKGLRDLVCAEHVPLVLAGVDYLLPIYREANTCAELVEGTIVGNPESLSAAELHAKAWAILEPLFKQEQERAADQFRALAGTGRAESDLRRVLPAAYEGRVESLFVAVGVQKWGRFERDELAVTVHSERKPGDEDLLDSAALETLAHAGKVYAVQAGQVPSNHGPIAAVFRY